MGDRIFEGCHVVIAGAAGALGSAVVAEAIAHGARVTALDQFASSRPEVRWIEIDLADRLSAQDRLAGLEPVDAYIHLVGGFEMGSVCEHDFETIWRRMFSANVETLLTSVRILLPLLSAEGSVVTIGAKSALVGGAGLSAYCASKSAVMRFTESLAAELKGGGRRANCVLPGIIDTAANRAAMPDTDCSEWTRPEDIARLICFLASSQSAAINGALIDASAAGAR